MPGNRVLCQETICYACLTLIFIDLVWLLPSSDVPFILSLEGNYIVVGGWHFQEDTRDRMLLAQRFVLR